MAENGFAGRAMQVAIMAAMLVGLPLLGLLLAGRDLQPYLEFPPLTRYVRHAPFSWWVFVFFAVVDLLFIAGMARLFITSHAFFRIRVDCLAGRGNARSVPNGEIVEIPNAAFWHDFHLSFVKRMKLHSVFGRFLRLCYQFFLCHFVLSHFYCLHFLVKRSCVLFALLFYQLFRNMTLFLEPTFSNR
jgi:hypothetical protein